ncbi:hypothetical protein EVAR_39772_1 [Eumeta japonica]|uniref:Uncharacterized protein n=1 Tax=Eumeta variegata TaxID=151549 RepID=A0A4C1X2U8_EUMVA|nr:hypothetical protein EVAR_39772_1 [Eumeta japonica]
MRSMLGLPSAGDAGQRRKLTKRAGLCRSTEHVDIEMVRCGSAAGTPDQEVVRRETLGRNIGSVSTSVNGLALTMCSTSSSRV